eukprot:jgi/Psemu1/16491/gm1.16491_g
MENKTPQPANKMTVVLTGGLMCWKGQLTAIVQGVSSHMSELEGFELGNDWANGTKAMTLDDPFVWGKKIRDGDSRTELDEDGAMTLWIKQATIEDRKGVFLHFTNRMGGPSYAPSPLPNNYDDFGPPELTYFDVSEVQPPPTNPATPPVDPTEVVVSTNAEGNAQFNDTGKPLTIPAILSNDLQG